MDRYSSRLLALLFLIGDYQAIRKNPLILNESAVHIQKGLRFHMTIPLEKVKGIRPYTSAEELWVNEKEALSLTLGGFEPTSPTFIIDLHEEIEACLFFGLKRKIKRVYLTVDERNRFWEEATSKSLVSIEAK